MQIPHSLSLPVMVVVGVERQLRFPAFRALTWPSSKHLGSSLFLSSGSCSAMFKEIKWSILLPRWYPGKPSLFQSWFSAQIMWHLTSSLKEKKWRIKMTTGSGRSSAFRSGPVPGGWRSIEADCMRPSLGTHSTKKATNKSSGDHHYWEQSWKVGLIGLNSNLAPQSTNISLRKRET